MRAHGRRCGLGKDSGTGGRESAREKDLVVERGKAGQGRGEAEQGGGS